MDITTQEVNELNSIIKIKISEPDYAEKVKSVLKDYSKKAKIDGFRPGKVPFGLVKKMYGSSILVEEINKVISNSLTKHIVDNKLNVLGEPLPNETEQQEIDWDNQTEFEFAFDIAVSPVVDVKLSKKDKIDYYNIKVQNKTIDDAIENYSNRFGEYKAVAETTKDEMIVCDIEEKAENGVKVDDASILLSVIKDEKLKEKFIGKKVNGSLTVDLKKAMGNNASELAGLLKVDASVIDGLADKFHLKIKEVKTWDKAEINQELFDKVYGDKTVKSKEEFITKVKEEISKSYTTESDYRFRVDSKEKLITKYKIELPDAFLKRWLIATNKGENKLTQEQIDQDYPRFADDLKWQLIKDSIIKIKEIKVTEEDIKESAKQAALYQFQQYGLSHVPDEHLDNYATEMLKNEDEKRKIHENEIEKAVAVSIKEMVKLNEKEISIEDLNKLYETQK